MLLQHIYTNKRLYVIAAISCAVISQKQAMLHVIEASLYVALSQQEAMIQATAVNFSAVR
jgi:hypothetical protein